MPDQIHAEGYGKITIAEDVIAACVREAVSRTQGIHELFGGFQDTLSQNILGKELKFKGIKISDEEDGVVIEIQIVVDYGVKIPEIAWDLQRRVKNELEELTDAAVKAVNVVVQGVHIQADKGGDRIDARQ
ncbi:MAG: Asp23/Gls24 family envelope stress response protein [Clostridiales Family XIII bacterium]|jgi:uncharacterized alkaline shock family protein YloU|nr:Asp23/Gls24 family envelope stress response protein [Clostridiales Family XIII bacterium]